MQPEQRAAGFERAVPAVRASARPATRDHRELSLVRDRQRRTHPRARRLLNVVVAGGALVLCAPVMLVLALVVKLTSRGPILYRQTRIGLDRRQFRNSGNQRRTLDLGGKPFTIYKFRTMHPAPADAPQVWASPDDPRVTFVGRFLRHARLDELPQLWNVLRGDMNIVGPRPEQPQIFMNLREQVGRYQHRQQVLPGITGWAQINRPYDRDLEDVHRKLHYDLEYISRQSTREDLRIMVRTIPVLLFGKGAW